MQGKGEGEKGGEGAHTHTPPPMRRPTLKPFTSHPSARRRAQSHTHHRNHNHTHQHPCTSSYLLWLRPAHCPCGPDCCEVLVHTARRRGQASSAGGGRTPRRDLRLAQGAGAAAGRCESHVASPYATSIVKLHWW